MKRTLVAIACLCTGVAGAHAQTEIGTVRLADVMMRDASVLADPTTKTYYIVASARGAAVRGETLRISGRFAR